jgi:hypothetical protein
VTLVTPVSSWALTCTGTVLETMASEAGLEMALEGRAASSEEQALSAPKAVSTANSCTGFGRPVVMFRNPNVVRITEGSPLRLSGAAEANAAVFGHLGRIDKEFEEGFKLDRIDPIQAQSGSPGVGLNRNAQARIRREDHTWTAFEQGPKTSPISGGQGGLIGNPNSTVLERVNGGFLGYGFLVQPAVQHRWAVRTSEGWTFNVGDLARNMFSHLVGKAFEPSDFGRILRSGECDDHATDQAQNDGTSDPDKEFALHGLEGSAVSSKGL